MKKRTLTTWMLVSAVVLAVLAVMSCSTRDPSSLDPGVPSNPRPGSSCATPNPGCACDTPGQVADCGEVLRKSGNYVSCSMGTMTCSGGTWGACIGDTVATKSLSPVTLGDGGLTTQDLQTTPTPCTDNPCDPGCTSYTDNGAGLDAGASFTPTDAGGLTLVAADGSQCTNLQCFQVPCSGDGGAATTTLTGRVVAGTQAPYGSPDPVPNVLVYVPNTAVLPFTQGVQCNTSCSVDVSGTPIAATFTAADGTFTLTNVPYGTSIPVVIQLGRWRRQVSFPITQCAANVAGDIHMPRNKSEGDIPLTAIDTGSVDAIECVLLKMGVDQAEFTDPGGTGRIQLYKYNGSKIDSSTPPESALAGNLATMDQYDQILLPCEGAQYSKSSTYQQNLINYTSSGGRAFATHYSYTWLYNIAPFSATANWAVNTQMPNSTTGQIDTSFAKGQTLATWMGLVGALSSTNPPQFGVTSPRQDIATTGVISPSVRWIYNANTKLGGTWPLHYTFDTPFNQTPTCGRVVFSDFHVADNSSSGTTFPNECPTGPMNAQEKALEFLLYDLSSCGVLATPPIPPFPNTYSFSVDYQGICPLGQAPVWRFFDWETVTPSDSSIVFNAVTAADQTSLATATPSVYLGTASGAPITTWTGTDVGAALAPNPSLAWLRVNITMNPSSDHYFAPTLTAWRQLYDCVANQ
ncbi:MAG TPA: hypothetical protein VLM85_33185 [Polyangiaceae bacterium]|nr:hypothetical protein [Polyangiaceae bacterium]